MPLWTDPAYLVTAGQVIVVVGRVDDLQWIVVCPVCERVMHRMHSSIHALSRGGLDACCCVEQAGGGGMYDLYLIFEYNT